MDQDQDIKNRIMNAAREQFYVFGFSKVTVDEIVSKLGISKKTFYKYFESKDALVKEVTETTMLEMDACCRQFRENDTIDFVEKLKNMMTFVAMHYAKVGKPLLEDLEKNAPHVWKQIEEHRAKSIAANFGNLLKEGVEKGIFRDDIDRELIMLIYNNTIQNIIRPEVLTHLPYSAAQVFETIVKIIFEGILTESARSRYRTSNASLQSAMS